MPDGNAQRLATPPRGSARPLLQRSVSACPFSKKSCQGSSTYFFKAIDVVIPYQEAWALLENILLGKVARQRQMHKPIVQSLPGLT